MVSFTNRIKGHINKLKSLNLSASYDNDLKELKKEILFMEKMDKIAVFLYIQK